ncbi:iron uptake porin [Okeania sp. KiyG1]|uniref:iron uptake porin n=1 Tax=Okeania sp. KiyG1 TaxID=2720165 RepID=UPI0019B3571D|nr:iron uptake porin [Okeania sp. KiyG1]GGA43124.1 porin [Okeania sp. KiyG1]
MSKILFNCLLLIFCNTVIFCAVTQANEIKYTQINSERKTLEKESSKPNITPVAEDAIIVKPNQLEQNTDSMGQVTSVSQLSDVQPTDWAFQALQSLVERYGCIVGYPDGSYRGNRPMTRYEFAAGLNACLDRITELIAASTADLVTKDDLAVLQRLQEDFAVELAEIQGRIDALEARTTELEANQFSTTTKLGGEIVFAISNVFGEEKAGGGSLEDNTVLNNRVSLNFNTSFTGRDLFRTRLDALDTVAYGVPITGTNMTRLAFQRNTNNTVDIGKLFYRFPVGKKFRVHVDAIGGRFNMNVSDNFNRLFANRISGAISRFGRFNPIYAQGARGAGVTVVYNINKSVSLSLGYLARDPENPTESNGFFNGSNAGLAQLDIRPSDRLRFGITYVRSYYPKRKLFVSAATGSRRANAPFGNLVPTSADHLGIQGSWRALNNFTVSGWTGWSFADAEKSVGMVKEGDEATIFNWAVTFGFTDLGKQGSLLGFVIGNPPKVTDTDNGPDDDDTAWHLEGFYRYQINDNISINPGVLVVVNPEHDEDNDTITVGIIRMIFLF